MAEYTTKDIRNIAAVGHTGTGKTSLLDHFLFKAGAVNRLGSVDEKNSIFDFETEEQDRQASIFTAMAFCRWKGAELNLIDAPGYADYVGAAVCALRAADMALLTVAAPHGVELNTRKMWAAAKDRGLGRVLVITKMDGENIVSYPELIQKIRDVFGQECLQVNLPVGVGPDFKGVVDLIQPPEQPPEGVLGDVAAAASALMDKIVESDEALMERYLNDEKLSPDELAQALRKGIAEGTIVPILHVSATGGVGVEELMDFLAAYAPSPTDAPDLKAKDANSDEEVDLRAEPDAPFSAQVFKIVTDPFVGKLSFFRVYQGTVTADSQVHNVRSGKNERIAQLFRVFGKEHRSVSRGLPGDIVAVSKVEDIHLGDTLSAPGGRFEIPPLSFPTPMVSLAVEPKARGDEQKISASLRKMADEDPTFKIHRDRQTGELVVTGMSQLHLDVQLQCLKNRFGVEVNTKQPRIPYKETITVPSESSYRHRKQTGGRGQFGEVWFKLEPLERSAGFEFVDKIVGGVIPNQFIPAVEKGVRETLARGILAGYPVEDLRVILHYGKHHDVDSSEAAFKLAGSMCLQDAFMKAKPVLLEPIVDVEVTMPMQYMGDITGDLNSRRGRIQGMESGGDVQTIRAQVPMAEVMRYATELRSMTGGTGYYSMEFSHYDVVPARMAEQVIAQSKKRDEK